MPKFRAHQGRRVVEFKVLVQKPDPKAKKPARYLGPGFKLVKKSEAAVFVMWRDASPRERHWIDANIASFCGGENNRLALVQELLTMRSYVLHQVREYLKAEHAKKEKMEGDGEVPPFDPEADLEDEEVNRVLGILQIEEANTVLRLQDQYEELKLMAQWQVLWVEGPEGMQRLADVPMADSKAHLPNIMFQTYRDAIAAGIKEDEAGNAPSGES